MKIESLEFNLYLDVFVVVFFFANLAKYFPDARLSPQIRSGLVVLTKSIIFSRNSILFLDFSYLLSIFFLLDDAFASPAPVFFSRQPYKNNNLDSSAMSFSEVCCKS